MTGSRKGAALLPALLPAVMALAACASGTTADRAYLRGFARAEAAGTPFAPITDSEPQAGMDAAYRLQRQLVAARTARGDRIAGFKGGLMSAASMRARGVTKPLAGVLFASGAAASGDALSLCGYRKASFELKLGFVFSRAVSRLPADAAALRQSVGTVMPVIDLPDIAYRDPDHYGAVDMVAANISAARYVRGKPGLTDAADLDALKVVLSRDGQPVASGMGRESMGNQWDSLLTVTREILLSGRQIAPGQLVLTGKIGDRGWLVPGDYRADYGPLGTVAFGVKPCVK